ncbi:MAG: RNA polymerase subunit sigma-24, partial [Candidatus Peregrinibacteria bacterium]|nr:RNA polymerase subunit sigma-24 [Candidatus Peregrinibacteria bacterium]
MLPTKDKKTDPMILMERAKSGDNDAYGELYEQYFTPIFRFILPKVSMRDTAEDLTQVVFIKVFE